MLERLARVVGFGELLLESRDRGIAGLDGLLKAAVGALEPTQLQGERISDFRHDGR
jgi:hypothetical protein